MIVITELGGTHMKKILKLTPNLIKNIIAEEKAIIDQANKQKLYEQLTLLKRIKDRQVKSLKEAKELHEIKKLLVKQIKGER